MQSCTSAGRSIRPSSCMTVANQSWPESKTSSSGFTPSSWKRFAPARSMSAVET